MPLRMQDHDPPLNYAYALLPNGVDYMIVKLYSGHFTDEEFRKYWKRCSRGLRGRIDAMVFAISIPTSEYHNVVPTTRITPWSCGIMCQYDYEICKHTLSTLWPQ